MSWIRQVLAQRCSCCCCKHCYFWPTSIQALKIFISVLISGQHLCSPHRAPKMTFIKYPEFPSEWNLLNCPTVYYRYSWNNCCSYLPRLFCAAQWLLYSNWNCSAPIIKLLSLFFLDFKKVTSMWWSSASIYVGLEIFILWKIFTQQKIDGQGDK